MRWIEIGSGDHEFAYRLEKHEGEDLTEVYETNNLDDLLIEANSWINCFTQYPPSHPPMVVVKQEDPSEWEDWMDEE